MTRERNPPARVIGILLAGGAGKRFGGGKLLATLADGTPVGARAAMNLVAVLPDTIAVVRPGDDALAAMLRDAGARVSICPASIEGMGASLAHGVAAADGAAAGTARGYVVALADMPWISADTIGRVKGAIEEGARIAVPRYQGKRGHPVGFGNGCLKDLLTLSGDAGAKSLIDASRDVRWIDVDDRGVVADIDVPDDLSRASVATTG